MIDSSDLQALLLAYGVPPEYASLYVSYGQKYLMDPILLAAQGMQESGYDAEAVSPAGAVGVAHFMPATWQEWKKRLNLPASAEPTEPQFAIEAQAAMMSSLIKYFRKSDLIDDPEELALAAYNAGIGTVKKFRGVPPYDETKTYIRRVAEIKAQIVRR